MFVNSSWSQGFEGFEIFNSESSKIFSPREKLVIVQLSADI